MPHQKHQLFKSTFFDFETVRILGTTSNHGADVAEVLEAISQIQDSDPTSWETAWKTQARRAVGIAESARASGDRDAARNAYLRAANYTRASGYMYTSTLGRNGVVVQDPRALEVAEEVGDLFRRAVPLMEAEVHELSIPYEDYFLPGLLYLPPKDRRVDRGAGKGIPVLVNSGGADSCQEELYFLNPAAGTGLGYAVVTFDGPGQGVMLRRYGLEMRPDWEVVTGKVIDYLEEYAAKCPELGLDLDAVVVSGASMGGYYSLRAAGDPRVKACAAIDPFYDMWDFGTAHVSSLFIKSWTSGWLSNSVVDNLMALLSRLNFQLKWEISVTGTFFNIASPARILLNMKNYTLASAPSSSSSDKFATGGGGASYLAKVKCPVLLSGAEQSLYLDVNDHTRRCYDALTNVDPSKKEIWVPQSAGEGGLQAKMGAFALCNQKTYQFFDRSLGISRPSLP